MGGKWFLKLALAGHDEVILGRFKKNHCYFYCWSEIVFLFKETDLEIGLQFHSCFVNATNDEFFRYLKNNLKALLFSEISTESAIRVLLLDKSPFLCSQTLYICQDEIWKINMNGFVTFFVKLLSMYTIVLLKCNNGISFADPNSILNFTFA